MNNAAFLPKHTTFAKGLAGSILGGGLGGYLLSGKTLGVLIGLVLGPVAVVTAGVLYLGGAYLAYDIAPKVGRWFRYRHLKVGTEIETTDHMSPSFCVEAPQSYVVRRKVSAPGVIDSKNGETYYVRHSDGEIAAYAAFDLIKRK